MDKWFNDILPDKDPYHNRGRDQMRKKGVRNSSACVFNKHNYQEKKTLVKRIFFLLAWNLFNSNFSVLISSCNFDVANNSLCLCTLWIYRMTPLVSCCARIVNQNKWPHDTIYDVCMYMHSILVKSNSPLGWL
jgi:hypothetical protein